MEKLIELLNEWYLERYETNPNFVRFEEYGGNDYGYFCSPDYGRLMVETEVWTKKYGFIKWLVDNNKIDYHNKINYDISLAINRVIKKTTREERLLMMLAIQDKPLEFLINILK